MRPGCGSQIAKESKLITLVLTNLKTKLHGFLDSTHELIKRARLCVATRQCRYARTHPTVAGSPIQPALRFQSSWALALSQASALGWRRSKRRRPGPTSRLLQ